MEEIIQKMVADGFDFISASPENLLESYGNHGHTWALTDQEWPASVVGILIRGDEIYEVVYGNDGYAIHRLSDK
jgi:hypothetical protein